MRAPVKFLTGISGAVVGYIVGSLIKSNQPTVIGGDAIVRSTSFTIGTVAAYLGAAIFAVVYAKGKFTSAIFLGWVMILIAITWSL